MRIALPSRSLIVAAAIAGGALACRSGAVDVHLFAINDLHGHLTADANGSNARVHGVPAGGVEYLATHLAQLRAASPNSLVVSAGDNVGASPLMSGLFHDEPTIDALNAAGLAVSAVGNHEFDEGWAELLRMQHGGCHPRDGCQDGTPFAGAHFQYLSANVTPDAAHSAMGTLPATAIEEVGGVKIGFIGMTLHNTKDMVLPDGVRGLTFADEADTANRFVPELEGQGVRAIVVLIHQGGAQEGGIGGDQALAGDVNGCDRFAGPVAGIAARISPDVRVIVSGHSHQAYVCTLSGKLVTSAGSYGRLITDVSLTIDRATDRVSAVSAHNVVVTRDVPKDPAETAILDHYRPFYEALAHRVVGRIAASLTRERTPAGETTLGDVAADAQLEAARRTTGEHVAAAFTNLGGLRSDLIAHDASGSSPVTYEDVYDAQPFENHLIVQTMTGAAIVRGLEQQYYHGTPGIDVLQVSGITYRFDPTKPDGSHVDVASIRIDGHPLDPARDYRVVVNDFVATGGAHYTAFVDGRDRRVCGTDIDALVAYLGARALVSPPARNRVSAGARD